MEEWLIKLYLKHIKCQQQTKQSVVCSEGRVCDGKVLVFLVLLSGQHSLYPRKMNKGQSVGCDDQ